MKVTFVQHSICVASAPDQRLEIDLSKSYEEHHRDCQLCPDGPNQTVRERLSPEILGVSRQLFEEAHLILWETNEFAFYDEKAFQLFLGGLNMGQKNKLRRISIAMDVAPGRLWKFDTGRSKHVTALKTVKKIYLFLEQHPSTVIHAESLEPGPHFSMASNFFEFSKYLEGLAFLDLEECSVNLLGKFTVNGRRNRRDFALTSTDKASVEKSCAAALLDTYVQERVVDRDQRRAEAEREWNIMRAAGSASVARSVAHRHFIDVCDLERACLQVEAERIDVGKKAEISSGLLQDFNKRKDLTREAIEKAKRTHERAIKVNEGYRTIWDGKEWWRDIINFKPTGRRNRMQLTPDVGPRDGYIRALWSKEDEENRLERAQGYMAQEEDEKGPDSEPDSDDGWDTYTDDEGIITRLKTPRTKWYPDDKTILRRLFDFPLRSSRN